MNKYDYKYSIYVPEKVYSESKFLLRTIRLLAEYHSKIVKI